MKNRIKISNNFLIISLLIIITSFFTNISYANKELDDNGNWYRYKGNSKNTGLSASVGPTQPIILWKYTTGDNEIATNPVIDIDGTIYFGTKKGNFYAINKDGSLKWRHIGNEPILSTPAINSEGVYVTTDEKIIGFSKLDGQKIFTQGTNLNFNKDSNILIGSNENIIYVNEVNGSFYIYDLTSNSVVKQIVAFGNISSPSRDENGNIYFTDQNSLYYITPSFDVNKALTLWSNMGNSNPVVNNNNIYMSGSKSGSSGGGRIVEIKNKNGYFDVSWVYELGVMEWFLGDSSSISKKGTLLSVSTGNSTLYALNPNGTLKWKNQISETFKPEERTSIVSDDSENIYLLTVNNELIQLNSNGELNWKIALGEEIYSSFIPSIGKDGTIYIPTKQGNLIAVTDKSNLNKAPTISIKTTTQRAGNQDLINIEGIVKDENIGDKITIKYSIKDTPIANKTVNLTQPTSITSNGQNQTFQGNININNILSGSFSLQLWAEDSKGTKSNIVELPVNIFNTLENILNSLKSYVYRDEVQFLVINSDTTITQNQENDRLLGEIKKELESKNILIYFIGKDGPTGSYLKSKLYLN